MNSSSPAPRGRWPRGPEGASSAKPALAPSVAPRQLPRIAGEPLQTYRNRVQTCVLQNGATMQPFSFSWFSPISSIVPE